MREEYPRPGFYREEWLNLNGEWDFYVEGERRTIQVPFVCQSALSGIGERITSDTVAYERSVCVPETWKNRRVLLNFGAVDYQCQVWINGHMAGSHVGGQTPFSLDVTEFLTWETEHVRVEVQDWLKDEKIARGKQFWEEQSQFIWYTPSTGIWQTVWMEPVSETRFEWIHFTPDIDSGTVRIDYALARSSSIPCQVEVVVRKGQELIFQGTMLASQREQTITVDVFQKKAMAGSFHFTGCYWSPEEPNLYDAVLTVTGERGTDQVSTYFGMRKIEVKNGRIYLNHRQYYQRLVLDQGYWKGGLITAPSDRDYQEDIRKAKEMGFNGCRKHEKVEDPRFLYWADHMGFLVWEAMASFWVYTPEAAAAFAREWQEVIRRDYNHPSIVVWEMLNESWGVPAVGTDCMQQAFAKSLYYMAHSMDSTRLVVSNDGWENMETNICAFHSYRHGAVDDERGQKRFADGLKTLNGLEQLVERPLFAGNTVHEGQPVMLTEFGGISLSGQKDGWGYTTVGKEELVMEIRRVMEAVADSELLCGYCYTQLADVEQEKNGLLTEEHEYKFAPEEIRNIQSAERN